jgi:Flp pilus assembly protein TadG
VTGRLRRLARALRDRRGATIVEFGFVIVPLSVVMLGFMDLGYQMYVRATLQGALNDVARAASVESPRLGGTGTLEQRVRVALADRLSGMARGADIQVQTSSYYDYSAVGRPERLVTDVNNNGRYDPGDCWLDTNPNGRYDLNSGRSGIGGADDVVFYNVTFTMPRLFPMAGLLGVSRNYEIETSAAVKNQPWANQRQPDVVC